MISEANRAPLPKRQGDANLNISKDKEIT